MITDHLDSTGKNVEHDIKSKTQQHQLNFDVNHDRNECLWMCKLTNHLQTEWSQEVFFSVLVMDQSQQKSFAFLVC